MANVTGPGRGSHLRDQLAIARIREREFRIGWRLGFREAYREQDAAAEMLTEIDDELTHEE